MKRGIVSAAGRVASAGGGDAELKLERYKIVAPHTQFKTEFKTQIC